MSKYLIINFFFAFSDVRALLGAVDEYEDDDDYDYDDDDQNTISERYGREIQWR